MDKRPAIPFRYLTVGILLGVLALVPLAGETYYTRLATRIMIYGICAVSLDLILGYGGMVSFGHAAFLGAGAYTVGLLSFHGVTSAWIAWPAAMGGAAILAMIIGAVCLRTSGVYFIMITLAFSQMLYYFFSSLQDYGGDDGMALSGRSTFGAAFDIHNHTVFFYLVFALLLLTLFVCRRLVHSRFGTVIQGLRENEPRMRAIGFPVFRYKLVCFVIAGALAGLCGALIANQTLYISPALMHWTRSGDILIMVILGGMGSLVGPVLGAAGLLVAEEILSGYTEHWMILLGPLLIIMVLYARNGIYGLVSGRKKT
ncbi:MAG: branched-chain amino acid ABC transporter permease [Pseudomonadota bacterium]